MRPLGYNTEATSWAHGMEERAEEILVKKEPADW
jgi:hypothetical protein